MNATDILILCALAAVAVTAVIRVRAVVRGKVHDEDVDFTALARAVAEESNKEKEGR